MILDAIVLAGGRSSRLGTEDKAQLLFDGESLLDHTLHALHFARHIVIVGPEHPVTPQVSGPSSQRSRLDASLAQHLSYTREIPEFGGPAAALAAGLDLLIAQSLTTSAATVVLACDMPHIGEAVPALRAAFADNAGADGVIGIDEHDQLQYLASIYSTPKLVGVVARHRESNSLTNLSVRKLVHGLQLTAVPVPIGATADVDTWDAAAKLGVTKSDAAL